MSDSKKIDDGGPAFPGLIGPPSEYANGMSIRDWFAGQALSGICASDLFIDADGLFTNNRAPEIAEASYLLADAMIEARSRS